MKILILGSRGMLGSMLCRVFAHSDPVCWDQAELDITRAEEVREKIITLRQAQDNDDLVIVNAAAYTDVDGAEANRDLAFAVNEQGVRHLAEAAKLIGARLVHFSTDYVFPGDRQSGYDEQAAPGPAVNVYGQSKLAGERALQQVHLSYYLIRTAWLYGPNGKNFVDTMLALASQRVQQGQRGQLRVVDDQHGSPTFTKDVAMAIRALLEEDYPPGIYHTVNAGSTTWYGFAQKIFEMRGLDVKLQPVSSSEFPRPARRPRYSRLINTRGPKLRDWVAALDEYLHTR